MVEIDGRGIALQHPDDNSGVASGLKERHHMVEQLSPNALACVRWADIDGLYFRDAAVFGMFPVLSLIHI